MDKTNRIIYNILIIFMSFFSNIIVNYQDVKHLEIISKINVIIFLSIFKRRLLNLYNYEYHRYYTINIFLNNNS